jgi:c-di-GMP-binding flagellar brake protein YcgR
MEREAYLRRCPPITVNALRLLAVLPNAEGDTATFHPFCRTLRESSNIIQLILYNRIHIEPLKNTLIKERRRFLDFRYSSNALRLMLNESDYTVHSRQQIIGRLTVLLKQKCLISISIGETEIFNTSLLLIDIEHDRILFDSAIKDHLNNRLLSAAKVDFKASVAGVKVFFQGKDIKLTYYQGDPALVMPIPKSLFWMQRREFYRVKLPLLRGNYVTLISEGKALGDLPLYDLSISGFAMINESESLAELFVVHRKFKDCRLTLKNVFEGHINFQVANCFTLNPNQPAKTQKIGCQFISLPPAIESTIQRYMQQLERESIVKNAI